LLPSLTATPFFATRPLLTAFVLALIGRYTEWVPGAPDWLISTTTLLVLGGLALVEVLVVKNDELRAVVSEFDPLFKALVNFIIVYLLTNPETSAWSGELMAAGAGLVGPAAAVLWSGVTAGSVWILAYLRRSIWGFLADMDEGDDLGLQGVLSWLEDLWVVGGTVLAVVFPLVSLAVYIATLLGLFLTQRVLAHVEERRKVPCPHCGTGLHASALWCHTCGQPLPAPRRVGLLGQPKAQVVADRQRHQQHLRSRKRCPSCATRLPQRTIQQPCPNCGRETFASSAELDTYLENLHSDLPRVLLVCAVLGLVPVLGIVPGVIYYHLTLIASLRSYVPRAVGCLARFLVTIINLLLIMVQWVPFAGAIVVSLMALTNYGVYRALMRRQRAKLIAQERRSAAGSSQIGVAGP
jgi:predicted RNA-binding Zn-ribbon protein involved in translation (DUF1610 family)